MEPVVDMERSEAGGKNRFFYSDGAILSGLRCGDFFQYLLTTILAKFIHYLIANMISIVLAAIFIYIINDIWTFSRVKMANFRLKNHPCTNSAIKSGKHKEGI